MNSTTTTTNDTTTTEPTTTTTTEPSVVEPIKYTFLDRNISLEPFLEQQQTTTETTIPIHICLFRIRRNLFNVPFLEYAFVETTTPIPEEQPSTDETTPQTQPTTLSKILPAVSSQQTAENSLSSSSSSSSIFSFFKSPPKHYAFPVFDYEPVQINPASIKGGGETEPEEPATTEEEQTDIYLQNQMNEFILQKLLNTAGNSLALPSFKGFFTTTRTETNTPIPEEQSQQQSTETTSTPIPEEPKQQIYAFFDVSQFNNQKHPAVYWKIVNEIPVVVEPHIAELFREKRELHVLRDEETDEEIVQPILLYHNKPLPTRKEHPTFGPFFFLTETTTSENTYPFLFTLNPPEETCFLLKKDLTQISAELLQGFDERFESCQTIFYMENDVATWCVKDLIQLLPVEPTTASAATDTDATADMDAAATEEELKQSIWKRLYDALNR